MASFWPICAQSTGDMYLSSKEADAKYASDAFLGYYTDYFDYWYSLEMQGTISDTGFRAWLIL